MELAPDEASAPEKMEIKFQKKTEDHGVEAARSWMSTELENTDTEDYFTADVGEDRKAYIEAERYNQEIDNDSSFLWMEGSNFIEEETIETEEMQSEYYSSFGMDTNGSNVLRLRRLVEQGLVDYVAMDIKNAPDKYGMTIGIEEYDMSNIFQSVDFLMSGDVPYEFRTTVVRQFHKREDFAAIGRWIKGAKQYYLQSFVDSGDLICPGMKGYTKEIMEQALEIVKRNIPNAKLRGV